MKHAHAGTVIGSEERGRRILAGEEGAQSMLRARGVDEAGPVEITPDRQSLGVVRVEIAAVPLRRRVQGWPVAEECDPPMARGR